MVRPYSPRDRPADSNAHIIRKASVVNLPAENTQPESAMSNGTTTTSSTPNGNANDIYDVTIIGAGPAGLFGAFYAGLREMKVKVIDALDEPGGQLAALYPEKFIYDVPGFPRIISRDLVKHLVDQAMMWKPTLCLGERVDMLARAGRRKFHAEDQRKGAPLARRHHRRRRRRVHAQEDAQP